MSRVGTRRWRGAGSRRGADGAARRGRGRPKRALRPAGRKMEAPGWGPSTGHSGGCPRRDGAVRSPPALRSRGSAPAALRGSPGTRSRCVRVVTARPGGRGRTGGGRAGAERSRTGAGRGAGGGAGGGGPVRPGPAPAGNSACCIYEKTSGGRAGWPRWSAVPCRAAPHRIGRSRAEPWAPGRQRAQSSAAAAGMQREVRRGGGRGAGKGRMGQVVGAFCTPGTLAEHPPAAPPGHSYQSHRISSHRIPAMLPPFRTSPSLPPMAQRPALLIPSYLRRPLRPSPSHPIPIFILISSHLIPIPSHPRASITTPQCHLSPRLAQHPARPSGPSVTRCRCAVRGHRPGTGSSAFPGRVPSPRRAQHSGRVMGAAGVTAGLAMPPGTVPRCTRLPHLCPPAGASRGGELQAPALKRRTGRGT